jgi:hypothetical protein
MIKSVRIKFEKILHDTGRAILVRINGDDHWLPKKLCRNLIINNKLGGNVCVPVFLLEKIGLNVEDFTPDIEINHHTPEKIITIKINPHAELTR